MDYADVAAEVMQPFVGKSIRPAVFRQGAPLFTRFEIIGYTLEGNNHFSVDYGLTILGPPGADGAPEIHPLVVGTDWTPLAAGGSGAFEAMLFVVPVLAILAVRAWRRRNQRY